MTPQLFRKQRVVTFTEADGFHFITHSLKPSKFGGVVDVMHDVKLSYKTLPDGTVKRVTSMGGCLLPWEEFVEFCKNPPTWFRGER